MMDGRVGYLRQALDENGFSHTAIMSYAAKYAPLFTVRSGKLLTQPPVRRPKDLSDGSGQSP